MAWSVISTVTNKCVMCWKVFDGALNADILIDFCKRLVKDARRKRYLILDKLKVQHSKPVKAWLAGRVDVIEVFCLPGYSPELKPNEMVNAGLKQAVTRRAPTRTSAATGEGHATHLRSVQHQPERVKGCFGHGPVRHAA